MPQVKIAHLRSIPDFQATEPFAELAEQISNRNDGISDDERKALDRIVAKGWGLGAAQRALIEQWWQDEGRQFV